MEIKAVIGVQIFSLFAITAIQLICLVIIFIKLCQIGKKLSPPPAPPVIPPRSAVPPNSPAPAATVKSIPVPTQPKDSKPSVWKSFVKYLLTGSSRNDVSSEYAVATTWLIRTGILILLCAAAFFLKYSLENDLVTPVVRVISTLTIGTAMFAAGYYGLHKRFHVIAIGILGAGAVILYMGAFAGFRFFGVLPQYAAFIIMLLTTLITMLTASRQSLLAIALTGMAGGYLTPVMLSDNSGNLPFFLAYTVIISAGIWLISCRHRWRSLEAMAFVLSFSLIFLGTIEYPEKITYLCPLLLLINFLIFILLPVIRKKDIPAGRTEWLLIPGATAFTLLTGVIMLESCSAIAPEMQNTGLALIIAGFTIAAGVLLAKKRGDKVHLLSAYLSSGALALAVAIPLAMQNSGALAAGWSLLAFIMVYCFIRSREICLLRLTIPLFVTALMAALNFPETEIIADTFAGRFFHGGIFTIALLGSAFLLNRTPVNQESRAVETLGWLFGGIAFWITTSIEVFELLKKFPALENFRNGGVSVWWAILAVTLLIAGIRKNFRQLRIAGLTIFAICLGKVCIIDIAELNSLHKVIAFVLTGIAFLGGAAAYIFCRKHFAGIRKDADNE